MGGIYMKLDLMELIPRKYLTSLTPEAMVEHSLLYLGRESLQMLASIWNHNDTRLSAMGTSSDSIEARMNFVSEAQICREKGKYLLELAYRAESKPQLFRSTPYMVNERVTCYFDKLPENARKLARNDHFVDAVITKASGDRDRPTYRLNFRDKNGKTTSSQFLFAPDRISLIPREDFPYFKCHPNFFRLYLAIHATTDHERQKIDRIISAL